MEQPKIYRYETVDSTNTVCRALAMEGAPDGTAVIARQQTAGRGRLGRRFESPPGMGLYLSMLWPPHRHFAVSPARRWPSNGPTIWCCTGKSWRDC